MRRNDHPSRPSAMTCCFFFAQDIAHLMERNLPTSSMSQFAISLAGFQVSTYGPFWVSSEGRAIDVNPLNRPKSYSTLAV
jgi:hypothetical protein